MVREDLHIKIVRSPQTMLKGFFGLWVFITGRCSGRGVQWMGVVIII